MLNVFRIAPRALVIALGITGAVASAICNAAESPSDSGSKQNSSASRNAALAPLGPQSVVDPDLPDRIIDSNPKSGTSGTTEGSDKRKVRQREGAKIVDRRGRFEIRGDRVIFLATNPDAHYIVLENLSLERVTRVLEESGSELEWSVTGTLTEFRSSNYLQIGRALVKSLPAKAEPRKLGDPLTATPVAPTQSTGFTQPNSTR